MSTDDAKTNNPEQGDRWDRKTDFGCWTCMYYVPKKGQPGRCRRNAPTLEGYPVVYDDDWCGEHKLGSNPIRCKTNDAS